MCKSCGCAASNNMQLALRVQSGETQNGLQQLRARLMGAPGVLHVEVDESAGRVLVDFSPQRTSQQEIEMVVDEYGVKVISAEMRELAHQHGVVAFFKRMVGK